MLKIKTAFIAVIILPISCVHAQDRAIEWDPVLTEVWEPVPEMVTPVIDGAPPSDAIILFDGDNLNNWELFSRDALNDPGSPGRTTRPAEWTVEDRVMTVVPGTGDIMTRQSFGDIQLHIEWRTPEVVVGEGQGRGNSGVFLQGLYEVQVLDSYDNPTYPNGQAGSVYKQSIPLVNASLPPGEWQTYDIFFEAPVFRDDGSLVKPAFVTVVHNGVLIQHRVKIEGPTVFRGLPKYKKHPEKLPLRLQDHGDLVSFRNIWVRELR
jgi:hypothetical protein